MINLVSLKPTLIRLDVSVNGIKPFVVKRNFKKGTGTVGYFTRLSETILKSM